MLKITASLVGLLSLCASAANVTFIVSVPGSTPAQARLSLGGDFNGWNPANPRYQMTRLDNGQYQYLFKKVKPGTVLNFKVTRGSWQTVEIDADGSNRDNRAYLVSEQDQTIVDKVEDWADLSNKEAPSTIVGEVITEQIELPTFSDKRTLRIYLPPNYHTSTQRYPVIYMPDGQNIYDKKTATAGEWQIDELMERLAADNSKLTSIVVGIDHADENRRDEYMPFRYSWSLFSGKGEEYADWLAFSLKPYIDKKYRTLPEREHTSMVGSSMGGLISCYTVLKHQAVFSKAGCLSSAFLKRLVSEHWLDYIKQSNKQFATKFYMDMGDNEFGLFGQDILNETQDVHNALVKAGFSNEDVNYQVIKGGTHDESSWRNRTLDVLTWLNN